MTWCHILEGWRLHKHCCKSLKLTSVMMAVTDRVLALCEFVVLAEKVEEYLYALIIALNHHVIKLYHSVATVF
jgi:hypothetical protein